MWRDPGRWLTTLRTRQRALLCALLPAFALSAASTTACAAAPTSTESPSPTSQHDAHGHGGAHAAHEHVAPDHSSPTPLAGGCPHCPLQSGAANAGHAACATADAPEHGGSAPTKHASEPAALAPPPSWRLPTARASPAFTTPLHVAIAFVAAVPLNVVHCVFLI
jgi:hypothetical protein